MRTYSSFLLFEEVLDFAPQSDGVLYRFLTDVTNPTVKVVTSDCLTKVGTQVATNYTLEGYTELSTGSVIDKARIDTLLMAGTYQIAIRHLYSCTVDGGICSKCYKGTYIDQSEPAIGTVLRLIPEYNYTTDVFHCNGSQTVFTLTQPTTEYTKALVIIDGVILTTGYTISETTLTMSVAPVLGKHIVVKYYKLTAQPFVGFLSKTYSGALLGMKPLSTQSLNIRPSLASSLYSDEELNIMKNQLSGYTIPPDNLDYIDTIQDKLERAIFISVLYGLFSNVVN